MRLWWQRNGRTLFGKGADKPVVPTRPEERALESIRLINQKIAELEEAQRRMDDDLRGPGGPDDSAGAVCVF